MGDEVAEDLFVLAAVTGIQNIKVILSPVDFRTRELRELPGGAPKWVPELHDRIKQALGQFQRGSPDRKARVGQD